ILGIQQVKLYKKDAASMTDCREQSWLFQDLASRKVEVDFGGGYLSSDGGGLILRELERHSGLLRDFSGCFVDYRNQRYIEHSVQELVSQRIHGLVLGYEDLNDHDHLRLDPIHGLIAGKSDPLGQDRILERDKGKALAAHSTLNRSIIAMAKHHVASGVIMMILVLTAPPICILGVFAAAVSKGVQQAEQDKRAKIANLVFEDVSGSPDGSYMYLKGRVRNNGTTSADFVKVEVIWLDQQGTILDTDETFVVGLEKLEPDAAESFEIMTPANPKMARYSYKFASN